MDNDLLSWCVLIPCLNEEKAVGAVVRSALELGKPVIVVDDGSDDRTAEIAASYPVILLRHTQRRGKGAALRAGFREALQLGFEAVVTMDGDGQHLATDIPRLVIAARSHPNSIVIGARLLEREQQPLARRRANAIADWWTSWACAYPVVDTQSGQRWYPRKALELADLTAENFVFETAILIRAVREGHLGVASIPIASRYQADFRLSHYRPIADIARVASYIARALWRYGHPVTSFRNARRRPVVIEEPVALRRSKVDRDGLGNKKRYERV
jgi:glycosyltransferase involved in cell wall biosynthesis